MQTNRDSVEHSLGAMGTAVSLSSQDTVAVVSDPASTVRASSGGGCLITG